MSDIISATHDKEFALPGWRKYSITTTCVKRSYLTYYVYAENEEDAVELYYELDTPDSEYVYDTDFEGIDILEVKE